MTTTFACLVRSDVVETWCDSEGRTRQLRYKKGPFGHLVKWDVEGTPFPMVRVFRTIHEARQCWLQRRADLKGRGFERIRPPRETTPGELHDG